jgi:flagellar export protein FliJ
MGFTFSLQPVLRLHASYERLERLRLLAIAAEIVRAREEIAAVARESVAARTDMHTRIGAGVAAAELHFELLSENMRQERKRMLGVLVAELEKRELVQQRAYRLARQKREILSNLRQRKWDEYRREQARREQQRLDELFLLHRAATSPRAPE